MRFIKTILLACILAGSLTCTAQEEATLQIGDTLYFDVCSETNYKYIDYFKKTRFEKDTIQSDTLTGWNFYNRFFDTGDFDVKRMPCSFSGGYGIIKHFLSVESKTDGLPQTVVIVSIELGVSAAYITEAAFINEEILYAPRQ